MARSCGSPDKLEGRNGTRISDGQMVEHQVDHDPRYGDIDPDRESRGRDQPVPGEVASQGPKQGENNQRNDAKRGQDRVR